MLLLALEDDGTAALIKGDAATIRADITADHYDKLSRPKPAELTTENLRAKRAAHSLPECVVWLPSNPILLTSGLVTIFQQHFGEHGQVGLVGRVQMQQGFLLRRQMLKSWNQKQLKWTSSNSKTKICTKQKPSKMKICTASKMVLGLPFYVGFILASDVIIIALGKKMFWRKINNFIQQAKSNKFSLQINKSNKQSKEQFHASLAHWKFILFCPVAAFEAFCGSGSKGTSCSTKCPTRIDPFVLSDRSKGISMADFIPSV